MLIDAAFLINLAATALIDGICCAHFLRADQTRMESYRSEIRRIIEEEFERLMEVAKSKEREEREERNPQAEEEGRRHQRRQQRREEAVCEETERERQIREIIQEEFEQLASRTYEKILEKDSWSEGVSDEDDDEQWKEDLRRELRAGIVDSETAFTCLPRRKSRLSQGRQNGSARRPTRFQTQGQPTTEDRTARFSQRFAGHPVRRRQASSTSASPVEAEEYDLQTQDTEETVSTSSFSSKSPPRRRRQQHNDDFNVRSQKSQARKKSFRASKETSQHLLDAKPLKPKQPTKVPKKRAEHPPVSGEIRRAPSGITTWTI